MASPDEKLEKFIAQLEEAFRDVPETVVQEGARSVVEYFKGRRTLAQMFNITPDMQRFMLEHGYNQMKTGRYDDADRIFKVLTFLDWNNPYFHSVRGSILQRQKKYGEAVAEYSEAIKLNSNDIVSLVNRAEIFLAHGHVPYAQHDLNQALGCTDVDAQWIERAKTMKDRIAQALSTGSKKVPDEGGKKPAKKGKKGGR
jgi:tetratricopeptide (TPR) repeat protein